MTLSIDSTLAEILADEAGKTALDKHAPELMDHPQVDQAMEMSLREIARFVPEQLAVKTLKAIAEDFGTPEINADPIVSGWLSLGALAASTGQQGIGWGNGIIRWRAANEGHPARIILDDLEFPDAGPLEFPRHIALLLPLTGKNAAAGTAIQNGFFGAYFAATAGLEKNRGSLSMMSAVAASPPRTHGRLRMARNL